MNANFSATSCNFQTENHCKAAAQLQILPLEGSYCWKKTLYHCSVLIFNEDLSGYKVRKAPGSSYAVFVL